VDERLNENRYPLHSVLREIQQTDCGDLADLTPLVVVAGRWHRAGFRAYWRWKSKPRSGRPKVPFEIRQLIRDMSVANPLWGAPRINGELLKLGIDIGQTTSPRTATARAPRYLPASVRVGAARCAPSAHDVRPLAS
jgi:hypothetical protein